MSPENVLVIKASSFASFKFGFSSTQKPYGYVISYGKDIGASTYTTDTSRWNEFHLVTRYLSEDGIKEDKQLVKIN